MRHAAFACLLALATPAAQAHDTWFEALPAPAGELRLALGTGNQYPRFETGIDARYLESHGCSGGTLQPLGNDDHTLLLRAAAAAGSCWAQVAPFDIELAPDKIELYLGEIGAGPELRATWAAMHARGLPWKERYSKHARIVLAGADSGAPVMALDARLQGSSVQVLRDGQPLPGLPLQLRSEHSAFGIWRRTDADGRITLPAALPPGRWLLRGTDLRPSDRVPGTWDSRFLTLAFEVQNSRTSNARSTNQTPATTAMTSEPPSSTTRR